jgi:hypothetical protein
MVWCLSQPAQASLDTLSKIRLPKGPGYGGKSKPSNSLPNFTHLTVLAITKYPLHCNQ